MAGETVVLLWGLFDDELYVEFDAERTAEIRERLLAAGLPI